MPRMSSELAEAVSWLSTQARFKMLLDHFAAIDHELQDEILMPETDAHRREILVNVKSRLRDDVLRVVEHANIVLQRAK
jgi:hypothetical protein